MESAERKTSDSKMSQSIGSSINTLSGYIGSSSISNIGDGTIRGAIGNTSIAGVGTSNNITSAISSLNSSKVSARDKVTALGWTSGASNPYVINNNSSSTLALKSDTDARVGFPDYKNQTTLIKDASKSVTMSSDGWVKCIFTSGWNHSQLFINGELAGQNQLTHPYYSDEKSVSTVMLPVKKGDFVETWHCDSTYGNGVTVTFMKFR